MNSSTSFFDISATGGLFSTAFFFSLTNPQNPLYQGSLQINLQSDNSYVREGVISFSINNPSSSFYADIPSSSFFSNTFSKQSLNNYSVNAPNQSCIVKTISTSYADVVGTVTSQCLCNFAVEQLTNAFVVYVTITNNSPFPAKVAVTKTNPI